MIPTTTHCCYSSNDDVAGVVVTSTSSKLSSIFSISMIERDIQASTTMAVFLPLLFFVAFFMVHIKTTHLDMSAVAAVGGVVCPQFQCSDFHS
jgi:hypothetical protein